jgi:hypothetical protein
MLRAVAVAAVLASSTAASADVLKLFAQADAGGVYGQGTSGDQKIKDAAFFSKAPHVDYGLLVGAEFVFLDVWIQHHQLTDGDRIATWTQFGLGVHAEIDFGTVKQRKAHEGGYFEFGGGGWFGLGTGQQIDPPLDNAQITDKAFIAEGRLGIGTHLSPIFDLGLQVPVSWGYFLKNGAVNESSNHYQGVQGEALLYLRANLRLL